MIKVKVEKILVICFIGFIIPFFVVLGGNPPLKASLPASGSETEADFENRLLAIEDKLASGSITKHEYDSISNLLQLQISRHEAMNDEHSNPEKMPEWVTQIGIIEPKGMKFEKLFSIYTSVTNPSERFNSVSLVYTGDYEKAIKEAGRIAASTNLSLKGNFKAKGSPVQKAETGSKRLVSYANYSLGNTDKDFLISVQVEPSGMLILSVTDNKQLNECLLAYEPLNNRQKSAAKQKKQ